MASKEWSVREVTLKPSVHLFSFSMLSLWLTQRDIQQQSLLYNLLLIWRWFNITPFHWPCSLIEIYILYKYTEYVKWSPDLRFWVWVQGHVMYFDILYTVLNLTHGCFSLTFPLCRHLLFTLMPLTNCRKRQSVYFHPLHPVFER